MSWERPDNKQTQPDHHQKNTQGPPELDKLLGNVFHKLRKSLQSSKFAPPDPKTDPQHSSGSGHEVLKLSPYKLLGLLILLAIIGWAIAGVYWVKPDQQAVVFRAGKFLKIENPGAHWMLLGIESKITVPSSQSTHTLSHQQMVLTKNHNQIDILLTIQYNITHPQQYAMASAAPQVILHKVVAGAVWQVLSQSTLESLISDNAQSACSNITRLINARLLMYHLGVQITHLSVSKMGLPSVLHSAWKKVVAAKKAVQENVLEAETEAKQALATAKNLAEHSVQAAKTQKQEMILKAQTNIDRFMGWLEAYRTEPATTRERLYTKTMEDILQHTHKVIVDTETVSHVSFSLGGWIKTSIQKPTSKKEPDVIPSSPSSASVASRPAARSAVLPGAHQLIETEISRPTQRPAGVLGGGREQ